MINSVAKIHQEKFPILKKYVEESHQYFKKNVERYEEFTRFVYLTSLTSDEISKLQVLQKPALEFQILEAFISRLIGEFAEHDPEIKVNVSDLVTDQKLNEQLVQTAQLVEAHMRSIFFDGLDDNLEIKLYKDMMVGGYSVAKVYTEYAHEKTFEQKIKWRRVFDPTMCGFDPLAQESHMGDGQYCFEIFPLTKEEIEEAYGKEVADNISYSRNFQGFTWSYASLNKKVALLADMYVKKRKKTQLYKLSNGIEITKNDIEKYMADFEVQNPLIQKPIIIQERATDIEHIERYILCEAGVIDHQTTSYKMLPLVFFDGNSVIVKESIEQGATLMTKPYAYNAKGIQKLKNFAGQTVAAELENLVQHKFKVAIEAIPEDYLNAYENVQQAQVLMYHAFYNGQPQFPLPPPMEIQRIPPPPIVTEVFQGTDRTTQMILGTYDAALGINDNQLSGKAIQAGGMQSNATARPYLIGFINGLNRVGQIILDLIPKFYVTPRSIPVRYSDGRRGYTLINKPGESIVMNYDPNDLEIKIEAGVNSGLQKQLALDQIIKLMGVSETFAAFVNKTGLNTLLDNIDIRGVEALKLQAAEFMQEMEQAQAQAAQQGDPMQKLVELEAQVEQAKVAQREQEAQLKAQMAQMELENKAMIEQAQLALEQQKIDLEKIKVLAEVEDKQFKVALEQEKLDAENVRSAIDIIQKSIGE